jgi:phosphoribosylanthranilate isomerase
MGADAVGFVFAPSSRQLAPQRAGDIARRLPPHVLTVGVFRDERPERVARIVNTAGLRAAQLHGRESARDSQWVAERVPVTIKAFAAGDPSVADAFDHGVDMVMVDGRSPGSGQVFDWSLAEGVPDGIRLLLAGGLTADNVVEAIGAVHPFGVDVSTGVERSPGHKDPTKVRRFIGQARSTETEPYEGDDLPPYDWADDDGY